MYFKLAAFGAFSDGLMNLAAREEISNE